MRTYRLIKNNIVYEPYRNFEKRKYIAQLRISAHKLKIETGRYDSHNVYINPEFFFCNQCSRNTKEDEFHFLLECDKYKCIRKKLFSNCQNDNQLFQLYSVLAVLNVVSGNIKRQLKDLQMPNYPHLHQFLKNRSVAHLFRHDHGQLGNYIIHYVFLCGVFKNLM